MLKVGDSDRSSLQSRAPSDPGVQAETEEYVSQLNKGSSNILVAVRARPLSKKEREVDSSEVFEILEGKVVVLLDPDSNAPRPEEAFRVNRTKEKQYAFDFAFDKHTPQQEVYQKTTGFLLEGVVSGFNATVFAYGSTGAGKTYTMLGDQDSPGLMLMTIKELYRSMNANSLERSYKVKLSYLEIYNENIRDLLSGGTEHLEIWEDPVKGITVSGLMELQAVSPDEVVSTIQMGNRRRTCEPTKANETSSRSHAVLQVLVEHSDKASGVEAELVSGKLSLIDLAGSERAANTQNRGMRLIEGANINRSLLALGNCINALFFANLKGTKAYIPYRDSKLTRILKDSLGGNCRTVMIACISPNAKTFEDTHNTLKYANRAKNIKTSVQRNVLNVSYHVSKYTSIIASLKHEIVALRDQLSGQHRSMLPSIIGTEKYMRELEAHFEEESMTVRKMLEIEHNIEKLGATLFTRLAELNQTDPNSTRRPKLENEVNVLKSTITTTNRFLETEENKLTSLQKRREAIEVSWPSSLAQEQVQELQLSMKERTLHVNKSLIKCKDDQVTAALKQRESYIHLLEGQLKLRDEIIDSQASVMTKKKIAVNREMYNGLVEREKLDDLSTVAKVCFPASYGSVDSNYTKSTAAMKRKKGSVSRMPLPKISRTMFENPHEPGRAIKPSAVHGTESPVMSKGLVHLPRHSERNKSIRKTSIRSDSSDSSSFSKSNEVKTDQRQGPQRKSPFKPDQSPGRPLRHRINERSIKYGSQIRRIEPQEPSA
jgi:kinesin family protein 18/19